MNLLGFICILISFRVLCASGATLLVILLFNCDLFSDRALDALMWWGVLAESRLRACTLLLARITFFILEVNHSGQSSLVLGMCFMWGTWHNADVSWNISVDAWRNFSWTCKSPLMVKILAPGAIVAAACAGTSHRWPQSSHDRTEKWKCRPPGVAAYLLEKKSKN